MKVLTDRNWRLRARCVVARLLIAIKVFLQTGRASILVIRTLRPFSQFGELLLKAGRQGHLRRWHAFGPCFHIVGTALRL